MHTWIVLLSLVSGLAITSPAMISDLHITPGISRTNLTKQEIYSTYWGLDKLHVTAAIKLHVEKEHQYK